MKTKTNENLIQLAAALLIFLFLSTAFSKIVQPVAFITRMSHLPLLSVINHRLLWLLPVAEILVVIFLFIPRFRQTGFFLSLVLLLLFTLYIIGLYIFSSRMPCSCGGIMEKMSWPQHIAFNIGAMLISLWGWRKESFKRFIAINRFSRNPV